MGTTLTAALLRGDEISFGHVGDSRAYLFREGALKQITNDHSLVEELRRQGRLSREQAADHPQRSVITRALGPEPDVDVDTMTFRGRPGDVFLLCSDGLTTMLGDEDLIAILRREGDLENKARWLVRAANDRGGRDNITVVLFSLVGDADDADATEEHWHRTRARRSSAPAPRRPASPPAPFAPPLLTPRRRRPPRRRRAAADPRRPRPPRAPAARRGRADPQGRRRAGRPRPGRLRRRHRHPDGSGSSV